MAKKPTKHSGRDRLEEAIVLLYRNQSKFARSTADASPSIAESRLLWAEIRRENAEHFERIERDLAVILRILTEHTRLLERLPDAICEALGFATSK